MTDDEWLARLKTQLDDDERVARAVSSKWDDFTKAASELYEFDDEVVIPWGRVLREVDALRRMVTAFEAFDAMAAEAAAKLDAGNETVRTDWLTACARAGALRDALRVLAKARYGNFPEWTL